MKWRYAHTASVLFALLLPLSSYWSLGGPRIPGILDLYVVPVFYLSDLAVTAFLFTGITGLFQEGMRRRRWYPFAGPLLALGGLAVFTAPFALERSLAGYTAIRWLVAAAVFLRFLQTDVCPQRFVRVFVVGLLVHVLVGVGQVLVQGPLGIFGEMALPLAQSGAAYVEMAEANWLRAYGLTFHPNVLGGYLAVALLLSMPLLSKTFWWLPVWWMLWGGLVLTFSRSAVLAALVTVPVAAGWLFWRQPSLRRSLGIALVGVVLVGLVGGAVFSEQLVVRLGTTRATEWLSLEERQAQIQVAMGVLAVRPLRGIGAGNFPFATHVSATALRPLPVHNVPLLLSAEVGVLGGAIWIWMFLVGLAALVRSRHRLSAWAITGLCAWFSLWIIGLFDYYPWGLNTGRLLSVTVLGLTVHAMLEEHPVQRPVHVDS